MARVFSALALARIATALLDGHIDVVVHKNVDIKVPKVNNNPFSTALPNVAAIHNAAQGLASPGNQDEGTAACMVAQKVIDQCYSAGYLEEDVPRSVAESCFCCYEGLRVFPAYDICANYLVDEGLYDGVYMSDVYEMASIFSSVCITKTRCTSTPTSTRPVTTTAPRACTSMVELYEYCRDVELAHLSTTYFTDMASCFCYDYYGNFDTRIQDWASACLPWIRTAAPNDYNAVSNYQTACSRVPPARNSRSSSFQFTAAASRPTDNVDNGFDDPPAPTSSESQPTPTTLSETSAENNSNTRGGAAAQMALPGFATLITGLLAVLLSVFLF